MLYLLLLPVLCNAYDHHVVESAKGTIRAEVYGPLYYNNNHTWQRLGESALLEWTDLSSPTSGILSLYFSSNFTHFYVNNSLVFWRMENNKTTHHQHFLFANRTQVTKNITYWSKVSAMTEARYEANSKQYVLYVGVCFGNIAPQQFNSLLSFYKVTVKPQIGDVQYSKLFQYVNPTPHEPIYWFNGTVYYYDPRNQTESSTVENDFSLGEFNPVSVAMSNDGKKEFFAMILQSGPKFGQWGKKIIRYREDGSIVWAKIVIPLPFFGPMVVSGGVSKIWTDGEYVFSIAHVPGEYSAIFCEYHKVPNVTCHTATYLVVLSADSGQLVTYQCTDGSTTAFSATKMGVAQTQRVSEEKKDNHPSYRAAFGGTVWTKSAKDEHGWVREVGVHIDKKTVETECEQAVRTGEDNTNDSVDQLVYLNEDMVLMGGDDDWTQAATGSVMADPKMFLSLLENRNTQLSDGSDGCDNKIRHDLQFHFLPKGRDQPLQIINRMDAEQSLNIARSQETNVVFSKFLVSVYQGGPITHSTNYSAQTGIYYVELKRAKPPPTRPLPAGIIAPIVISSVLVVVMAVGAVAFYLRKSAQQTNTGDDNQPLLT